MILYQLLIQEQFVNVEKPWDFITDNVWGLYMMAYSQFLEQCFNVSSGANLLSEGVKLAKGENIGLNFIILKAAREQVEAVCCKITWSVQVNELN